VTEAGRERQKAREKTAEREKKEGAGVSKRERARVSGKVRDSVAVKRHRECYR
jgi:hypothetical protein